MVLVSDCLDELALRHLTLGQVAESECLELDGHVQQCARCSKAYEAQFAAMIEALRMPSPPESVEDSRRIAGLIARLKVMQLRNS